MKRSTLATVAVLLLLRATGIGNAQTMENAYSNKFVGLSFPVPAGWYVATDNETRGLMPDAARVMGLDDPAARSIVAQIPGKVLLIVSERPLSSEVQDTNRNIIFVAINASQMKGEISSGADYLGHVARGIREGQPSAAVSDIVTQRLAGEEFHRLNVSLLIEGITAHVAQLARIHNEYLVILNMTAATSDGLTELVQIVDRNILLSAVPQEVDRSPEGQLFRKQSTIDPPASSSGNLLKTIGIVLMVLGALAIAKNVFSKK